MIRDWHGAARYVYNQCMDNFDIILLPTFETKYMVKRALLNEFCKFTQIFFNKNVSDAQLLLPLNSDQKLLFMSTVDG